MLDSLAGVRIPGQYSIRHNFEGGHVGTQTHANRQFGGRQFAQTGLGTPGDAVTQDIRKYDYIDALRGYAILAVLLVHSTQQVAPINLAFQRLASHGGRGVQLFYIASALTLCLSWQFRASLEAFPVRNFFIRRFFRIAPMFYVAMAFYLCLYGFSPRYWAPNGLEWWYLPLTALFLNGYHPETLTSVVPGGWSVAVEMNFYLVLPFLLLRLKTMKSLLAFLLLSLLLNVMDESASLRWAVAALSAGPAASGLRIQLPQLPWATPGFCQRIAGLPRSESCGQPETLCCAGLAGMGTDGGAVGAGTCRQQTHGQLHLCWIWICPVCVDTVHLPGEVPGQQTIGTDRENQFQHVPDALCGTGVVRAVWDILDISPGRRVKLAPLLSRGGGHRGLVLRLLRRHRAPGHPVWQADHRQAGASFTKEHAPSGSHLTAAACQPLKINSSVASWAGLSPPRR